MKSTFIRKFKNGATCTITFNLGGGPSGFLQGEWDRQLSWAEFDAIRDEHDQWVTECSFQYSHSIPEGELHRAMRQLKNGTRIETYGKPAATP